MELLKTAWISFLSIIVLFLLTKLMGNKQLSQLSMFDYIIGISIGSIAAECSFEDEHPERMIVAMIIYALSAYAVSIITGKSTYFRKVLIDEGYGRYFDQVCFAINGKEDNKNITAFRKTFEKEISD